MSEKKEIVYKNMVYYCPVCGSKKNHNEYECGIE